MKTLELLNACIIIKKDRREIERKYSIDHYVESGYAVKRNGFMMTVFKTYTEAKNFVDRLVDNEMN